MPVTEIYRQLLSVGFGEIASHPDISMMREVRNIIDISDFHAEDDEDIFELDLLYRCAQERTELLSACVFENYKPVWIGPDGNLTEEISS